MQFIKSIKTKNNGQKLSFRGELTIFNATTLKDELFPYLEQSKDLSLDFNGVTEADTAFVQILIQLKRECAERKIDISVASCSEPVAALLRTFRLTDEFNIDQIHPGSNKN
jgi:anti-anti-sigma factor